MRKAGRIAVRRTGEGKEQGARSWKHRAQGTGRRAQGAGQKAMGFASVLLREKLRETPW
jgi:hypothetical protein